MLTSSSRLLTLLWLCATWLASTACNPPPTSGPHPLAARAATKKLADVPTTSLAGTLRGKPFKLADARVRIETRAGRERVDVYLSETPIERCGLPLARHGRRVWLRLPGQPVLDGAELRVEAGKPGPFEPHYEVELDDKWLGHGGGAALLSLKAEGFGRYAGQLWACFDDGLDSCVAGSFQAAACRSELDVDDSVWGAARLEPKQAAQIAP
jgi:hypothetical protein